MKSAAKKPAPAKSPGKSSGKSAPAQPKRRDTRQTAIDVARLALASRCHTVNVLDVAELSGLTDYLILATGTSGRQMKGVADEIEEAVAEGGHHVMSRSVSDESWILLDFVDFVVHLFSDEARQYYDLDNLWGDAKRVQWKEKEKKD